MALEDPPAVVLGIRGALKGWPPYPDHISPKSALSVTTVTESDGLFVMAVTSHPSRPSYVQIRIEMRSPFDQSGPLGVTKLIGHL